MRIVSFRALVLSTTLAALLAAAPGARAGTLHVDADLVTGRNDGASWADAFQGTDGLRAALAAAVSGDQIFVAEGTYLPSPTGAQTASFDLSSGVAVYGGFLGGETSPAERPPFGAAPSVLSGDLNGDGTDQKNSYHVVSAVGTSSTAVLDGFTVRAGNAYGPTQQDLTGAGIQILGAGSPTIRHCVFQSNRSSNGGHAASIAGGGSAPRFLDCTFRDGVGGFSGSNGGGVRIGAAGPVRFERCVFENNTATTGGGLWVVTTVGVLVTDCQFFDNVAGSVGQGGGAAYVGFGAGVQFRGSTVVSNTDNSNSSGGLLVDKGSASVGNCIFWDNVGPEISGASVTYSIVDGGHAGAGNLSSMPLFVDYPRRDLALTIGSPGIDAGSNGLVPAGITLDLARNPRFSDELTVPDTGSGGAPLVDMGALEWQGIPIPTFCDGADGSLAACPCGNPGLPEAGCDIQQGTGGVELDVVALQTVPQNRATLLGTGFPLSNSPASVVIRSNALDPSAPVVFGDGLRCVGVPLVRLAATISLFGQVRPSFGHGAMAGSGSFYYQLWFRNAPAMYCTPAAFNLSNGRVLTW